MSTEDKKEQTEIGLGVGVLGRSWRDIQEQIGRLTLLFKTRDKEKNQTCDKGGKRTGKAKYKNTKTKIIADLPSSLKL